MYEADYKKTNSEGAATFMLDRVIKKYEAGFEIALDTKSKVGETDKTSAQLAQLSHTSCGFHNAVVIAEEELAYVTLTGELGKEKGYGQVLNFIITGSFDGAWDYPEGTEFKFQAKVMSPIKGGKVAPKAGSTVTIKASDLDGFKFGNELIIGQTYNSEVTYKVLQDKVGAWSRNDIASVAAVSSNTKYFEIDNNGVAHDAVAGKDADD